MSLIQEAGEQIVILAGAAATFFGAKKGWEIAKGKMEKDSAVVKRDNFQELYDRLTEEMKTLRSEIKALREEQAAERQQWATERQTLQSKIDGLTKLNSDKDVQIANLQGKVEGLTSGQAKLIKASEKAEKS